MNGQILYEDDLVEVMFYMKRDSEKGEGGIKLNSLSKDYGLNPYFVYEWREYRVRAKAKEGGLNPEGVRVFFGDDEASYDRDEDFWEYTFRNYIGKSEVKIRLRDRLLPPLKLEVISDKLSLNEGDKALLPIFLSCAHRKPRGLPSNVAHRDSLADLRTGGGYPRPSQPTHTLPSDTGG